MADPLDPLNLPTIFTDEEDVYAIMYEDACNNEYDFG